MAIQLVESPGSRRQTFNVSTNKLQVATLQFKAFGDSNDANIRAYLNQHLPRVFENLILDDYDLDPETDVPDQWVVSSKYKLPENTDEQQQGQPVSVNFTTSGGTTNIRFPLQRMSKLWCRDLPGGRRRNPQGEVPDCNGAINASEDSVEGCEKYVPTLEISWTYNVYAAAINVFTIYKFSGKVNSTGFRGFAKGELLFLGCDGTADIGATGKLTYKFIGRPNATLSVSGSDSFFKQGWDYVWVRYQKVEQPDVGVQIVPLSVYCDRIYEEVDFNLLGIL